MRQVAPAQSRVSHASRREQHAALPSIRRSRRFARPATQQEPKMPQNVQVLIASLPSGPLAPEHFELRESPVPDCGARPGAVQNARADDRRRPARRTARQRELRRRAARRGRHGRDRRRARRGIERARVHRRRSRRRSDGLANPFCPRGKGAAQGPGGHGSGAAPRRPRHQRSHRVLRSARHRRAAAKATRSSSRRRRARSATSSRKSPNARAPASSASPVRRRSAGFSSTNSVWTPR